MKLRSLISLTFSLLLLACSPQKRLQRLLNKHPELLKTDTTYIIDSIAIPSVSKDTIFHESTDTVIIKEKNLTIKYYHTRDSIRIMGECKGDTVLVQVPVIKTNYQTKDSMPLWAYIIIIIESILLLAFTFRCFR